MKCHNIGTSINRAPLLTGEGQSKGIVRTERNRLQYPTIIGKLPLSSITNLSLS